MNHSDGNAIHRRVPVALLELIVLGFFVATLANSGPSSLVFTVDVVAADGAPPPGKIQARQGAAKIVLGNVNSSSFVVMM